MQPIGGTTKSLFAVAGATGHVGSVVARELLAAGHKVRAIVRSVDKAKALSAQGAELLSGELSDVGFLTRALRGADGALPAAQRQGILPNFFPAEHKLATIATRDIAAVVVRTLLSPPAATQVVYVMGTHEYSAVDQAAYLSKKLGKEIKLLNLPVSAASGAIQQSGVSASLANLMQEMYEGALKGLLAVEPGHRVEKGITTLEEALDPHFAK